ncbi:MAG TPA: flavin reductase family protein [Zeimonas sp.]|nr:flavin reductase family protein [Zeimonas sp.]
MRFDPSALDAARLYKLLAALVVPRPIALVTTRNENGTVNAAPYSFFNILSDKPPVVGFGAAARSNGQPKDTVANLERTKAFVVHLVDAPLLDRMNVCSVDFAPGESEIVAAGLGLLDSERVDVPRIAEAPVHLECRHRQTIVLSERASIVLGDVVCIHVRPGLLDERSLHLDLARYRPVGRLFGTRYVAVDEHVVELPRLGRGDFPNSATTQGVA